MSSGSPIVVIYCNSPWINSINFNDEESKKSCT